MLTASKAKLYLGLILMVAANGSQVVLGQNQLEGFVACKSIAFAKRQEGLAGCLSFTNLKDREECQTRYRSTYDAALARCKTELKSPTGEASLIDLVGQGQAAEVIALLNSGVDPNVRDREGRTPLLIAARPGRIEILRALIKAGADLRLEDNDGDTALAVAVHTGNFEAVKALVSAGADINAKDNDVLGHNALMHAAFWCASNRREILTLLLDAGTNIEERDEDGSTALSLAAYAGNLDAVELLLTRGADVNTRNNRGVTPLMMVGQDNSQSANERLRTARLLVDRGADVNRVDSEGWTALTTALYYCHDGLVELLLARGARENATDLSGRTPLMLAALKGNLKAARLLLSNGAEVNAKDGAGRSALAYARAANHQAVVRLLRTRGAKE